MEPTISDDPSVVEDIFKEIKQNLKSRQTMELKFRKQQVQKLIVAYEKLIPEINAAYKKDLGYGPFMTNFTAHAVTIGEFKALLKGIDEWVKPESQPNPVAVGWATSQIEYQPLGLVLVLSAWNYPIYTALPQVAAAIVAGNGVILKPSEMAPYTSNVIKKLIDSTLDQRFYRCLEGKAEVAKKCTSLPFDCICFTGSSTTGRLVAMEAAKNLIPCILELGGKCPTVVDETAAIDSAVIRILFGKFFNCGQTCIGVDHIFVQESIKEQFKKALLAKVDEMWGKGQNISDGQFYGKIINIFHAKRLEAMLTESHGGKILYGGEVDKDKLFVAPTVIESPRMDSALMCEEIFGPILPIQYFGQLDQVIDRINTESKPLVVYMFSENNKNIDKVKKCTSSGAYVVNDTIVHMLNTHLPFGGVGKSGNGRWSGKAGFTSFSNAKTICRVAAINPYPLNVRFPPYTPHKQNMMNLLLKTGGLTFGALGTGLRWIIFLAVLGAGAFKYGPKL